MSGHNKFSNIKHKKEKNDAVKGKVYTKLGREIAVAVKEGGPDPNNNSRLKDIIAKAKAQNMPNDTIDRSIKKAAGDGDNVSYVHVQYEGYGPKGTAIIVDGLTDNKNRTAANVRAAFSKGYGNIGAQGCVSFMFDEKGQIVIDKEECDLDYDEIEEMAIEAGAEDISDEDETIEIITAPEDFSAVLDVFTNAKVPMLEADITMIPQTYVELTDENDIKCMQRIIDLLEDDDDVQNVYHNWDE